MNDAADVQAGMSKIGGEAFQEIGRGKMQQRPQSQQGQPLRCPRCNSANTKFCYYNNYSRSQPRYFCKACRRYWTKGGALRNVPVGGRRKAKRVQGSRPRLSLSNSAPDNAASEGNTTPASSPSPFGTDLLFLSNGDLLGELLPLPSPLPQFSMISSQSVDDGGGHSPFTSPQSLPLFNSAGQNDLPGVDAGMMAFTGSPAPWELLPSFPCHGGAITTSSGLGATEPSPSSSYWDSCWDDLVGFLLPDHEDRPPLPQPSPDILLS